MTLTELLVLDVFLRNALLGFPIDISCSIDHLIQVNKT